MSKEREGERGREKIEKKEVTTRRQNASEHELRGGLLPLDERKSPQRKQGQNPRPRPTPTPPKIRDQRPKATTQNERLKTKIPGSRRQSKELHKARLRDKRQDKAYLSLNDSFSVSWG